MDAIRRDTTPKALAGEARAAFTSAIGNRDAGQAATVYAEYARLLAPSAEVLTGRQEIERFWQAGLDAGLESVRLDALELEHRDGRLQEIGRYQLRVALARGAVVMDGGKYLVVHERQSDGTWRWALATFNPDAAPRVSGSTWRSLEESKGERP